MKKLIALLLVLALSLTAVAAFADAKSNTNTPEVSTVGNPSKTVPDMNKSETKGTNNNKKNNNNNTPADTTGEESFMLWVTKEASLVEKANEEIAKLKEVGVAEYFGKAAEIAAIVGELAEGEAYNVHEFSAVRASNADKVKGSATVAMTFAANYEKGSQVAVMINAGSGWNVTAGSVQGGGTVEFSVGADLAKEIEENYGLLAIVSK